MRITGLLAAAVLLYTAPARSDVLLTEQFEERGEWRTKTNGAATVELADHGVEGKCLKLSCAEGATAYYTVKLEPERVRGRRLVIRAMVKTENVTVGAKPYCTAKFHVGGRSGGRAFNRAKWFSGTRDWREEEMIAPVPEDIEKPVFDLAIQAASGTAYFDKLVIDDGLKPQIAIDLAPLANTNFSDGVSDDGAGGFIDTGTLDLRDLPRGDVELDGAGFYIMQPGENCGATCIALRGLKRPNLPTTPKPVKRPGAAKRTPATAPVGFKGGALLFLHAAAWVDATRGAPCLIYAVRYADGETIDVPIREGVDIGAFDAPKDLANWKVAWTGRRAGRTVGLGVARWRNPRPDVKIESISLRTPGAGAVPIVAAVSLDRGRDQ